MKSKLHEAYDVLGLPVGSSMDIVFLRHRTLAVLCQPDLFADEAAKHDAQERLVHYNNARDFIQTHFDTSHINAARCACYASDEELLPPPVTPQNAQANRLGPLGVKITNDLIRFTLLLTALTLFSFVYTRTNPQPDYNKWDWRTSDDLRHQRWRQELVDSLTEQIKRKTEKERSIFSNDSFTPPGIPPASPGPTLSQKSLGTDHQHPLVAPVVVPPKTRLST